MSLYFNGQQISLRQTVLPLIALPPSKAHPNQATYNTHKPALIKAQVLAELEAFNTRYDCKWSPEQMREEVEECVFIHDVRETQRDGLEDLVEYVHQEGLYLRDNLSIGNKKILENTRDRTNRHSSYAEGAVIARLEKEYAHNQGEDIDENQPGRKYKSDAHDQQAKETASRFNNSNVELSWNAENKPPADKRGYQKAKGRLRGPLKKVRADIKRVRRTGTPDVRHMGDLNRKAKTVNEFLTKNINRIYSFLKENDFHLTGPLADDNAAVTRDQAKALLSAMALKPNKTPLTPRNYPNTLGALKAYIIENAALGSDLIKLTEQLEHHVSVSEHIYAGTSERELQQRERDSKLRMGDADPGEPTAAPDTYEPYNHRAGEKRAVTDEHGAPTRDLAHAAESEGEIEKSLAYVVEHFINSFTYKHHKDQVSDHNVGAVNAGGSGPNGRLRGFEHKGSEHSRDVANANYFRGLAMQQVLKEIEEKSVGDSPAQRRALQDYINSIDAKIVDEIIELLDKKVGVAHARFDGEPSTQDKKRRLVEIASRTRVRGQAETAIQTLRKKYPSYIGGYCGALQKTLEEFGAALTDVTSITMKQALHDEHNNDFKDVPHHTWVEITPGTDEFKDWENSDELRFREGKFYRPATCVHSQCYANIDDMNVELTRNLRRFLTGIVPDADLQHYELKISSWSTLPEGDDFQSLLQHLPCESRFSKGPRPFTTGDRTEQMKIVEGLSLTYKGEEIAGQQQNHADAHRSNHLQPFGDEGLIDIKKGDGRTDKNHKKEIREMEKNLAEKVVREYFNLTPAQREAAKRERIRDEKVQLTTHITDWLNDLPNDLTNNITEETIHKLKNIYYRAPEKQMIDLIFGTGEDGDPANPDTDGFEQRVQLANIPGLTTYVGGEDRNGIIGSELAHLKQTLLALHYASQHPITDQDRRQDEAKLKRHLRPPKKWQQTSPDTRIKTGGGASIAISAGTIASVAAGAATEAGKTGLATTIAAGTSIGVVGTATVVAGAEILANSANTRERLYKIDREAGESFDIAVETFQRIRNDSVLAAHRNALIQKRKDHLGGAIDEVRHLQEAAAKYLAEADSSDSSNENKENYDFINRINNALNHILPTLDQINQNKGELELRDIKNVHQALIWTDRMAESILKNLDKTGENREIRTTANKVFHNMRPFTSTQTEPLLPERTSDGREVDLNPFSWGQLLLKPSFKDERALTHEIETAYNRSRETQAAQKDNAINAITGSAFVASGSGLIASGIPAAVSVVPILGPAALGILTGASILNASNTERQINKACKPELTVDGDHDVNFTPEVRGLDSGEILQDILEVELKREQNVDGWLTAAFFAGLTTSSILGLISGVGTIPTVATGAIAGAGFAATNFALGNKHSLAASYAPRTENTPLNDVFSLKNETERNRLRWWLNGIAAIYPEKTEDVLDSVFEVEKRALEAQGKNLYGARKGKTLGVQKMIHPSRRTDPRRPIQWIANRFRVSHSIEERVTTISDAYSGTGKYAEGKRFHATDAQHRATHGKVERHWETDVNDILLGFRYFLEGKRSQSKWQHQALEGELINRQSRFEYARDNGADQETLDAMDASIKKLRRQMEKMDNALQATHRAFDQMVAFEQRYRAFLDSPEDQQELNADAVEDAFKDVIIEFAYSTNALASVLPDEMRRELAAMDPAHNNIELHTEQRRFAGQFRKDKINNIELKIQNPLTGPVGGAIRERLKEDAFTIMASLYARAIPTLANNELATIHKMHRLAMEPKKMETLPTTGLRARLRSARHAAMRGIGISTRTQRIEMERTHLAGIHTDATGRTPDQQRALKPKTAESKAKYASDFESRLGDGHRRLFLRSNSHSAGLFFGDNFSDSSEEEIEVAGLEGVEIEEVDPPRRRSVTFARTHSHMGSG